MAKEHRISLTVGLQQLNLVVNKGGYWVMFRFHFVKIF